MPRFSGLTTLVAVWGVVGTVGGILANASDILSGAKVAYEFFVPGDKHETGKGNGGESAAVLARPAELSAKDEAAFRKQGNVAEVEPPPSSLTRPVQEPNEQRGVPEVEPATSNPLVQGVVAKAKTTSRSEQAGGIPSIATRSSLTDELATYFMARARERAGLLTRHPGLHIAISAVRANPYAGNGVATCAIDAAVTDRNRQIVYLNTYVGEALFGAPADLGKQACRGAVDKVLVRRELNGWPI